MRALRKTLLKCLALLALLTVFVLILSSEWLTQSQSWTGYNEPVFKLSTNATLNLRNAPPTSPLPDHQPQLQSTKTVVEVKNASTFNALRSPQNDSALVELIRRQYLMPPSPLSVPLNLRREVWNSPVAKIVMHLLKNQTGGFFVECGAYDGEDLSNSLELERKLNWTGLLIEADPQNYKNLSSVNRKSWFTPVCLAPQPHPMMVRMQRHKKHGVLSGIVDTSYGTSRKGDFPFKFDVQCFPLYSLLLALNRTEVDYLSLDVEGAEWNIIQTIPFDKVTIKVISLESYKRTPETDKYLASLGYINYTYIKAAGVDDAVFVKRNILFGEEETTVINSKLLQVGRLQNISQTVNATMSVVNQVQGHLPVQHDNPGLLIQDLNKRKYLPSSRSVPTNFGTNNWSSPVQS